MNQGESVMQISDIVAMLRTQNVSVAEIKLYQKNNRVIDYLLDHKYILRISKSILNERMKLDRAKSISFVQKIHAYGSFTFAGQKYHYLIIDYIDNNISSLEYQAGARLLHNDFHPKNIIIHEGQLAGIIDWECSQFGEADFELAHLFHWCIYPTIPDNNLSLYLKSIVKNLQSISGVPNFEKRLTIYQLEHELNQLMWNGLKQEEERMQRINGWLSGQIHALLEEWQIG